MNIKTGEKQSRMISAKDIPEEHIFKEEPKAVFFHFQCDGKEYVYNIRNGRPVLLGMMTEGPHCISGGLAIRYGIREGYDTEKYNQEMDRAKADLEGILRTEVKFTPFERKVYKSPQ